MTHIRYQDGLETQRCARQAHLAEDQMDQPEIRATSDSRRVWHEMTCLIAGIGAGGDTVQRGNKHRLRTEELVCIRTLAFWDVNGIRQRQRGCKGTDRGWIDHTTARRPAPHSSPTLCHMCK